MKKHFNTGYRTTETFKELEAVAAKYYPFTDAASSSEPVFVSGFAGLKSHLDPYDFYTNGFGRYISGSTAGRLGYAFSPPHPCQDKVEPSDFLPSIAGSFRKKKGSLAQENLSVEHFFDAKLVRKKAEKTFKNCNLFGVRKADLGYIFR